MIVGELVHLGAERVVVVPEHSPDWNEHRLGRRAHVLTEDEWRHFDHEVNDQSYRAGYDEGYEEGKDDADDGQEAYEEGRAEGYRAGWDEGHEVGFDEGFEEGFEVGLAEAESQRSLGESERER